MPRIDPELVQPLNIITDTLLKRPGLVSLQSIKRLSEIYGFTTFVEHSKVGMKNSEDIQVRLSISGLVLLIDIDFVVKFGVSEYNELIGSPNNSLNIGATAVSNNMLSSLSNQFIENVSISSAIVPDGIDGESYDFLFGFGNSFSSSDILLSNLKEKTLDAFNKNLRVLLFFDRLSKNKPDDLFTMFSEIVWGITKKVELDKAKSLQNEDNDEDNDDDDDDWDDGINSMGKVLVNQKNKVGVFLKYWVDDRYTNRWIQNEKNVKVNVKDYMMHFKVKESFNYKTLDQNLDGENDYTENTEVKVEDSKLGSNFNENVDVLDVKLEKNTMSNIVTDSDTRINSNDNIDIDVDIDGDGDVNMGNDNGNKRMFDTNDMVWKIDESHGLITLEMCPSIWIPDDVLKFNNIKYEVMTSDNENWGDNQNDGDLEDIEYDSRLDKFYKSINDGDGCIRLYDSDGEKLDIQFLVGCKMVRLFKMQLGDINKLQHLLNVLRNWCKLNSMLRKVLIIYDHKIDNNDKAEVEEGEVDMVIELGDVFQTQPNAPIIESSNNTDNERITITTINIEEIEITVEGQDKKRQKINVVGGRCAAAPSEAEICERF